MLQEIFFSQTKSQTNFYPIEEIPNLKQLHTDKKIKTQIFFDKKNNVEKLVINAPLQKVEGLPDLNWTLILSQDTATAFATQRQ
ncbi:hypothetical protein HW132_27595 [Brasilonema sp. CT11]|nr:hypothetical protein [Brasilonema sp. CT11]